jgi:hypothetical protein
MLTIEVSPKMNVYTVTAVTGVCVTLKHANRRCFSASAQCAQDGSEKKNLCLRNNCSEC